MKAAARPIRYRDRQKGAERRPLIFSDSSLFLLLLSYINRSINLTLLAANVRSCT